MPRRPLALAASLAFSVAHAAAAVPTYSTFELQARSNIVDGYNLPPNSSFNSKTPALNDSGRLACTLIYVGGGNPGLFVGGGGSGSVVYSAPAGRTLEDPSINAAGSCAFDQADFFSEGVFVYDAVSGTTTQRIAPTTFDQAGRADLTDDGAIGFRGGIFAGPQSWRVHQGGTQLGYASEGGTLGYLFLPSTNDAKRMAGKVRIGSTAGSAPDQIRVYDGPSSFVVVAEDVDSDASSPFTGFDNGVSLANDGSVAFVANLVGGGRGVFRADTTSVTPIATDAGPDVTEILFFTPAVNAHGLVAFRGRDAAGLYAIFAGDGSGLRRVIGEHDLVPTDLGTGRIDQHDASVVFGGGVAINTHGDIAFNASLTPPGNNQIEWGSGMFIAYADGPAAPPPVPDGAGVPGSPMRASRDANGIDVVVEWDVTTCPGEEYNLFFGDLEDVSEVLLAGAECGLGTSGTATFTPPPGDVFFVVASEDAAGVESGHGVDGAGAPRPSNGIGFCGVTAQSLAGMCP